MLDINILHIFSLKGFTKTNVQKYIQKVVFSPEVTLNKEFRINTKRGSIVRAGNSDILP
jgi:hypothetical protein